MSATAKLSTNWSTTTTIASVRMFKVHLFQALACNDTPGITLVLSKLVSLASDHGFRPTVSNKQQNNQHVGRGQCQQQRHVERDAGYVSISNNWWVRIYLCTLCLLQLHLLLPLQLQPNSVSVCLFLSTALYHQQQCWRVCYQEYCQHGNSNCKPAMAIAMPWRYSWTRTTDQPSRITRSTRTTPGGLSGSSLRTWWRWVWTLVTTVTLTTTWCWQWCG